MILFTFFKYYLGTLTVEQKKEKVQTLVLSMSRAIRFGAMPWSEIVHVLLAYAYSPFLSKVVCLLPLSPSHLTPSPSTPFTRETNHLFSQTNDVIKQLLHVVREREDETAWKHYEYEYSALRRQYLFCVYIKVWSERKEGRKVQG
jgi:hypothetical protein